MSTMKHGLVVMYTVVCFVILSAYSSISFAQSESFGKGDTLKLCFISDTQEPMWVERVYLQYNRNAEARTRVFQDILEFKPRAVFHLGDIVSSGSDTGAWADIDQFVDTLRRQSSELFPIPGNHEYMFQAKQGMLNFTSRFPYANVTGYARQYGGVAVILFNSNAGNLSQAEREAQLIWYERTIASFEADSTVLFVIVGCHHSPYTNSKIVSSDREVQRQYLPAFFKAKKTKLFVSGHAHACEHFRVNGKDFLVIGGGGGIQQPVKVGREAEFQDLYSRSLEKRMFHYLTIQATGDSLRIEIRMLKQNFSEFYTIPRLSVTLEKSNRDR